VRGRRLPASCRFPSSIVPPEGFDAATILEVVDFLRVLELPQTEQDRVGELIVRMRRLRRARIDGEGLPAYRGRG
jgi:hypothetical protein